MSRERTLVMLGSTSVGKSALTNQFINGIFIDQYDPTIAKTYRHKTKSNGINYELTVCDTAGLEQQSQIQTQYINANGFILVYSITDRQSFDIICEVFEKLRDVLNGENKPVILIGNKTDLTERRRITTEDGRNLARSMNAEFMETSARLGNNVKDVFTTLLKAIDGDGGLNSPTSSGMNGVRQQHHPHHHQQQQQQQLQQQQSQSNQQMNTRQRPSVSSKPANSGCIIT